MYEKSPAEFLAEILESECPDSRIGEILSQCMTATVRNRDGSTSVDFKTRLATAQTVINQRHGLPVRRAEVTIRAAPADSTHDLEERLVRSPALIASLKAMILKAEAIDV